MSTTQALADPIEAPARMEARFLAEQGIRRIALPLRDGAHALTQATATA